MSDGRERLLSGIRDSLGRGALDADTRAALERRLRFPRANVVPARGQHGSRDALLAGFITEAERVNTSVQRLPGWDGVATAVADFLRAHNLPQRVRVAGDALFKNVTWSAAGGLEIEAGPAEAADTASVTGAYAGIAETGTLMLLSGPGSPTLLNFLPPNHIVVLPEACVVGTYEDAWHRLRAEVGTGIAMPRVINWITGPSRTADIEQTLLLGAHGPRRLHVLLVDGASPAH
ncbi:MAG: lactate utilization protein C [Rhodospirillales bacterium]|nr:MAG: lactate utilization protein C [Rhodospirillales bacterium]